MCARTRGLACWAVLSPRRHLLCSLLAVDILVWRQSQGHQASNGAGLLPQQAEPWLR